MTSLLLSAFIYLASAAVALLECIKGEQMKILVERKKGFDNKAQTLAQEFKNTLGIEGVKEVRYLNMYVITGLDVSTAKSLSYYVFADPTCENLYYDENIDALLEGYTCFAYSSVKGRYDRRT